MTTSVDAFYFQRLLMSREGTLFVEPNKDFVDRYLRDLAVTFLQKGHGCIVTGLRKASVYARLSEHIIQTLKAKGYDPAVDWLPPFQCAHINSIQPLREGENQKVSLILQDPGEVYAYARGYLDRLLDTLKGSRVYVQTSEDLVFPLKRILLQHGAYLYKDPVI